MQKWKVNAVCILVGQLSLDKRPAPIYDIEHTGRRLEPAEGAVWVVRVALNCQCALNLRSLRAPKPKKKMRSHAVRSIKC